MIDKKASNDFKSVFYSNDLLIMKDYLMKFGKKPKPISPIIFIKKDKENIQNERTDNSN